MLLIIRCSDDELPCDNMSTSYLVANQFELAADELASDASNRLL